MTEDERPGLCRDDGHPHGEFYACTLHNGLVSKEYLDMLELASDLNAKERARLEERVRFLTAAINGIDQALADLAGAGAPVARVPGDLARSVVRTVGGLLKAASDERAEWRHRLEKALPEAARQELAVRQAGLDAARRASTKLRNSCALAHVSGRAVEPKAVFAVLNVLDTELEKAR